jgi:hypothetical protein
MNSNQPYRIIKVIFSLGLLGSLIACDLFDSTPKCSSTEIQPTLESLIIKDIRTKLSNRNIGRFISKNPDPNIQYLAGVLDGSSDIFQTSANVKIGFDNFLTSDKAEGKKRTCTAFISYKIDKFNIQFDNSIQASISKNVILMAADMKGGSSNAVQNFMGSLESAAKMETDPNYAKSLFEKLNQRIVSSIPTKAKIDFTVQKTESGKDFFISILSISATE